ncbi:S-formylglutathione hydrolase FrmB [Actinopolymorpha cephalotaxi]|uniref:S-formylglutathione hydrolase FrmB n=1 Tax=Actinopolymorpha cephalotaxi TaxID=504797 RepID=A0A1I2NFN4_9ACTN|nr:alpha/beta hydrolase family protein [Actinopolymorpha cephalotaxi]NYH85574.1 S-formylglutathione hydrolase FrmB [Actinopolymorpha cephalotaxi]SFG01870.1 S-formylglutathione hydrolase FrmB [Actinopolymorpha cephalotaxi]
MSPLPTSSAAPPGVARAAIVEPRSDNRRVAVLLVAFLLALSALVTGAAPARAATAGTGSTNFTASIASTGAAGGARVVGEEQVAPRQIDLTIDSPALGTTAKVRLLTPDGWEHRRPGRHWPVLYLLHGCCGDYTSWTALTDVASIPALRNVLVVMPEAGNIGFYSDWYNAGQAGPPAWERFHLTEVRRIVERDYGAGHRRVVAGLSMGGFGALSYAGRHPGMFRAAASYSGVVDTRYTPGATQFVLDLVGGYVDDPMNLWGDPSAQAGVWAAHNPVDLVRQLRRIPIYLSCGNGQTGPLDPPGRTSALETLLESENRVLADRLEQAGARRVETHFYGPGTHSWPYWQRELHRSLPMLLDALH